MHPHTPATLKEIFRPWYIRVAAAIAALPAAVGLYASVQDQFPAKLPRLQEVVTVSHFFVLPWWAWLFVLQAIFLYALFDYLRRVAPATAVGRAAKGSGRFGFAEAMPSAQTPEHRLVLLTAEVRDVKNALEETKVSVGAQSTRFTNAFGQVNQLRDNVFSVDERWLRLKARWPLIPGWEPI